MNELQGEESTEEIRRLVRDNAFLQGIRLTGKGRTKKVIINEINQRIKISNLAARVQTLETDVQQNCTEHERQKESIRGRLDAITEDIKTVKKKVKGNADLQRVNAASDNEKLRQIKVRISRMNQKWMKWKGNYLASAE